MLLGLKFPSLTPAGGVIDVCMCVCRPPLAAHPPIHTFIEIQTYLPTSTLAPGYTHTHTHTAHILGGSSFQKQKKKKKEIPPPRPTIYPRTSTTYIDSRMLLARPDVRSEFSARALTTALGLTGLGRRTLGEGSILG